LHPEQRATKPRAKDPDFIKSLARTFRAQTLPSQSLKRKSVTEHKHDKWSGEGTKRQKIAVMSDPWWVYLVVTAHRHQAPPRQGETLQKVKTNQNCVHIDEKPSLTEGDQSLVFAQLLLGPLPQLAVVPLGSCTPRQAGSIHPCLAVHCVRALLNLVLVEP